MEEEKVILLLSHCRKRHLFKGIYPIKLITLKIFLHYMYILSSREISFIMTFFSSVSGTFDYVHPHDHLLFLRSLPSHSSPSSSQTIPLLFLCHVYMCRYGYTYMLQIHVIYSTYNRKAKIFIFLSQFYLTWYDYY